MLKLTKKADYSLIALRHAALVGDRPASAKEMSDLYRIPLPILAKVLQKLNKAGFLTSVQGTNGGYKMSRDAGRISVLEVIRAVDGPVILTSCFTNDHNQCDQSINCTVKEPLRRVHLGILELLQNISILDLTKDETPTDVAAHTANGNANGHSPLQDLNLTILTN